jgi:hypothetical protein
MYFKVCYKNLTSNLDLTKWSQIPEVSLSGLMEILLDLDMDYLKK